MWFGGVTFALVPWKIGFWLWLIFLCRTLAFARNNSRLLREIFARILGRDCSSSSELLPLLLFSLPVLLLLLVSSFCTVEVGSTGCTCLHLFVGNGSLGVNTLSALSASLRLSKGGLVGLFLL